MKMRLDRFLSEMGIGTRSQLKRMCRAGRVAVNGTVQTSPEFHVDPETDRITVDGRAAVYDRYQYYMMNKPAGVVTATRDPRQKTVMDLMKQVHRKDLFPVGRLDIDTEGLLLLTNDGALANRLLSPKHHAEKVYRAIVRGRMTEETAEKFAEGVDIGDETLTRPAKLDIVRVFPDRNDAGDEEWRSEILLTITEGRYHQVKRMFLAVESEVLFLRRERMGGLSLDHRLAPGEVRRLTEEEIRTLIM